MRYWLAIPPLTILMVLLGLFIAESLGASFGHGMLGLLFGVAAVLALVCLGTSFAYLPKLVMNLWKDP